MQVGPHDVAVFGVTRRGVLPANVQDGRDHGARGVGVRDEPGVVPLALDQLVTGVLKPFQFRLEARVVKGHRRLVRVAGASHPEVELFEGAGFPDLEAGEWKPGERLELLWRGFHRVPEADKDALEALGLDFVSPHGAIPFFPEALLFTGIGARLRRLPGVLAGTG
ncbi:MAG: hypothetical protein GWO24_29020 [Akkermansiaceae bacterium]|nr:hypothetical protein [Akkermansiaceae bacterium]